MTDADYEKMGEKLVEMLGLKKIAATDRYPTSWGSKTTLDLGKCITRINLKTLTGETK